MPEMLPVPEDIGLTTQVHFWIALEMGYDDVVTPVSLVTSASFICQDTFTAWLTVMLNVLVGPPTTSITVGVVGEKLVIFGFTVAVDPRASMASFARVEDSLSILFTFTGSCTPQLSSDETNRRFQYLSLIHISEP